MNTNTDYEKNYTPEQRELAEHIIGLEKHALDLWFNGKTEGYRNLWSENNFTYVDGAQPHRVDTHKDVCEFLDTIEGQLHADTYDFVRPRVQFGQDMALLTYELYADTNMINMKYNCIELYQKEADSQWRVIHSTWSFIRPMEMDFGQAKEII